MDKIADIPVEEQVTTLMASCEYEPPKTKAEIDLDKDHMDVVL